MQGLAPFDRGVRWGVLGTVVAAMTAGAAGAQRAPGTNATPNLHVLAHVPVARGITTGYQDILDIDVDQDLARPYVYIAHYVDYDGFDIIDIRDPRRPRLIYQWQIENMDLRRGGGASGAYNPRVFKRRGRHYVALCTQFGAGKPDRDLGAIIFDVTGLPDTTTVKEAGRITYPASPGGFHNLFTYRHSDGRALLFTTTTGPRANIYDLERFLDGDPNQGLIGHIPRPPVAGYGNPLSGYHDMYVAYDPIAHQDKFYGAGLGAGYFVYDVSRPESPRLLTSMTGIAGMASGHAFQATPDGRYGVVQMEYQYAPIRIFDLKPGLEGSVQTISRPIGAWSAAPDGWRNASHNHQIRWPYVFVASFDDGLQVVNIMDPANPFTVAFWDTQDGPDLQGINLQLGVRADRDGPGNIYNGAWGVQVRNADGLILVADFKTGFWIFKMDGFDGWNGHHWGVPNISSAQDWDNGPDGAPKPKKVT